MILQSIAALDDSHFDESNLWANDGVFTFPIRCNGLNHLTILDFDMNHWGYVDNLPTDNVRVELDRIIASGD